MFTYEKKQCRIGVWHYDMMYGDERIGHAEEVEGGFIAQGRRKPVATIQEAAKQCLDSKMNQCLAEHERLRKILNKVLSEK